MRILALLLLAALASLSPGAAAHGAAEASELEVELLADEETDAVYATGGFDVAQVFLGEAHAPALGAGPEGDGLYFRALLAGRTGAEGPSRITFTFETPDGSVSRVVTVAGTEVTSDFDALTAEVTDDGLAIERAFVRYASAGLSPGVEVTGFRVATASGQRQVDVAPGGLHAGPLEAPAGESRVVTDRVTLAGPGQYLDVTARLDGDTVVLTATSLLKKGSQHLELALEGTSAVAEGPTSVSVGPAGSAEFRLRGASAVDVTTDVGGRERILVEPDRVLAEDGTVLAARSSDGAARDVPLPAAAALGALALAGARRRR